MIWAGHVWERPRNVYKILVRIPDGERLLGTPGHMWVNKELHI
jgi:hypothetical protein